MSKYVETVIVGGGQAGLATSYYLTQQGRTHTILEQASQPAEAWRNHRWDSFVLVTPNWSTRMPGAEYQGDDPDGFMPRDQVVAYLEEYIDRFRLPIRYGIRVSSVECNRPSLRTGHSFSPPGRHKEPNQQRGPEQIGHIL